MTERVQLYHGDCLDVMKRLPAGSVDAVITDPPFGIGFKYNMHKDESEGYAEWLWSVCEEAESKCKPGSPVFVWQSGINVRRFSEWFPREWRLFIAAKNFVQMRPIPMQHSFDPVIVWWTPGDVWSAGEATRDFHIADTTPQGRKRYGDIVEGHPCPRPLHQVKHIIEQWVKPDGVVLDCFMGSGTTGIAAIETGRRFVGVEIDPEYYRIASERINTVLLGNRYRAFSQRSQEILPL